MGETLKTSGQLATEPQGPADECAGLIAPAPMAMPVAVAPLPMPRAGLVFERIGGSEVMRVTGAEDIRLKCGKAEIVLCADGRIILRGTELILESEGQLKLNGAYVNIN